MENYKIFVKVHRSRKKESNHDFEMCEQKPSHFLTLFALEWKSCQEISEKCKTFESEKKGQSNF